MFLPSWFSIFFYVWCLSFINTMQKTLNLPKNVSKSKMDEKKLHTREFQLKGSSGNMRCKLLQKGLLEKQQSVPNTCAILPLKKIFYQHLTDFHFAFCIFQISLKYIKLVFPKILFILVYKNTLSPKLEGGRCMHCILK